MRHLRIRRLLGSAASLVGLAFVGGATGEGPALAASVAPVDFGGRWVGVVLFQEGQTELDMVVRLRAVREGEWSATVDLDLLYVRDRPADEVLVIDRSISLRFDLGDRAGVRVVEGALSDDGSIIEGSFTQAGATYPMVLVRRADEEESAGPVAVEGLASVADFAARFRDDEDRVRLVLLLSPS